MSEAETPLPATGVTTGYDDPTHPAVVAVVDHYVNSGFDPSYADYYEVAQVTLEALAKAGMTLVLHMQSVDGDGNPLRYCATCFRDWPCVCSSERQGAAKPFGHACCQWCGRAIKLTEGTWVAVKGTERGYDPLTCDANTDTGQHEPKG